MKRNLLLMLVTMIAIFSLCGCTSINITTNESVVNSNELEEVQNFNETGYPIVKDKITLHAIVASGAQSPTFSEIEYFKKIEELTNVHMEYEQYKQNSIEKVNLLFASRDFPDLLIGGGDDKQIFEAAQAGDIIALDELIDKYAPNIQNVFDKFPYAKKVSKYWDGKIYSLPYINDSLQEKGIRDQFAINITWLDELGISIPETVDDFYQVLKAIKDNAGKGSIPETVIPWYFRYNQRSKGQLDLYGSYGVLVNDDNFISVDKDKKVVYQAINPLIKEPIKFLNKLYKEKLFPEEVFTDDNKSFQAKVRSDPPLVGAYSAFNILNTEDYTAIAPLKTPYVEKPLFRTQNDMVQRNYFSIFSKNKYPEVSIRWADTIAEPDWSIQGMFGMFDTYLKKLPDGNYEMVNTEDPLEYTYHIPQNDISLMLTRDLTDKIVLDDARAYRLKNIKELYAPYIVPIEMVYPPVSFSEEQFKELGSKFTDIKAFVDKQMAKWIVEGGIDSEWDEYVKKIYDMGIDKVLEIYQSALDEFYK